MERGAIKDTGEPVSDIYMGVEINGNGGREIRKKKWVEYESVKED